MRVIASATLLAPFRLSRAVFFGLLGTARGFTMLAAVLGWRCHDAARGGFGSLRRKLAAGRAVIRLGGRAAGAQHWTLIINLNIQPHPDGLGASGSGHGAWIGRPAEA